MSNHPDLPPDFGPTTAAFERKVTTPGTPAPPDTRPKVYIVAAASGWREDYEKRPVVAFLNKEPADGYASAAQAAADEILAHPGIRRPNPLDPGMAPHDETTYSVVPIPLEG